MISIKSVSYHIGRTQILRDVTLDVPRGGVTALIGPNGAGKSTLLSLIARLNPLQSGQIMVEDLHIGSCPDQILAQTLSILPQSQDVTPRLTVAELIAFGRYPYSRGRLSDEDRAKVDEALALFELESFAGRTLDSLSGGQRQRAYVAMTFAQDTAYMLLDEPLNNLDIAASRALMRLLRSLAADHKKTVLIVLHDINYACRYADHIVAMKDGTVHASGPPEAIVTSAFVRAVFGTDAEVTQADGRPLVLV